MVAGNIISKKLILLIILQNLILVYLYYNLMPKAVYILY